MMSLSYEQRRFIRETRSRNKRLSTKDREVLQTFTHGTYFSYQYHDCRCKSCQQAYDKHLVGDKK